MATRPNKNTASTTTKAGDSGSDAAGEAHNRFWLYHVWYMSHHTLFLATKKPCYQPPAVVPAEACVSSPFNPIPPSVSTPNGSRHRRCQHGKRKTQCKHCGGSSLCRHKVKKNHCSHCRIPTHKTFCLHGRQKSRCVLCHIK
jgi:hypothetical protein